ncbi:MAG: hypothetical protein ACOYOK_03220 [Pseudobdellovibrionaceae bacterium]
MSLSKYGFIAMALFVAVGCVEGRRVKEDDKKAKEATTAKEAKKLEPVVPEDMKTPFVLNQDYKGTVLSVEKADAQTLATIQLTGVPAEVLYKVLQIKDAQISDNSGFIKNGVSLYCIKQTQKINEDGTLQQLPAATAAQLEEVAKMTPENAKKMAIKTTYTCKVQLDYEKGSLLATNVEKINLDPKSGLKLPTDYVSTWLALKKEDETNTETVPTFEGFIYLTEKDSKVIYDLLKVPELDASNKPVLVESTGLRHKQGENIVCYFEKEKINYECIIPFNYSNGAVRPIDLKN